MASLVVHNAGVNILWLLSIQISPPPQSQRFLSFLACAISRAHARQNRCSDFAKHHCCLACLLLRSLGLLPLAPFMVRMRQYCRRASPLLPPGASPHFPSENRAPRPVNLGSWGRRRGRWVRGIFRRHSGRARQSCHAGHAHQSSTIQPANRLLCARRCEGGSGGYGRRRRLRECVGVRQESGCGPGVVPWTLCGV